jgi:feruloyl-CoA synthase
MMSNNAIEPAVNIEARSNGELLLTSPYPLGNKVRSTAHILLERAEQYPDRTLLAQRESDGWKHLTYAEAVSGAQRVAQWLIDKGASTEHPLAILSGSSINHFLRAWGAIFARVPYVPVSLSYSTVTGAYPKLNAVLETVKPGFIFAEQVNQHGDALASIDFSLDSSTLIACDSTGSNQVDVLWEDIIGTEATEDVDQSIGAIDHDTVSRYMFTSGSTGMPKGVIVTHGMTCHLLASAEALRDKPDPGIPTRVLDWMPWSHVGAGVMRLTNIINVAGSIYLDTGKPVPEEFHKTLENLRAVKPTQFSGAPLGWSMLVDALESDDELARLFYTNIRSMQSGSAAMPDALAERIQALNIKYTGQRFPFGTSLLSTEVHVCLSRYWPCERSDVVGLPGPGVEIKLVPLGEKYEMRVRGPGTTPGYLNDQDKTRDSFDEEGFFKMGDAVRFADPTDPSAGLCFAGRVAEEFKLITGTWVSAGTLRAHAVTATSPYVRDVVVCGINENFVGLLIWPNLRNCARLARTDKPDEIIESSAVREAIAAGLRSHNESNRGSSRFIRRFLLLAEPPDQGAHEITDKGYVNQGAVQERRANDVARLFTDSPDEAIVEL